MTPVLLKSAAAIAAVAGLAYASVETSDEGPYDGAALRALSQADVAGHAERVFARADIDRNDALDVDEYIALAVVTAELARLNGFVVIEKGDEIGVIELPQSGSAALPKSEHIRIAAVTQNAFYAFAGADGRMSAGEFAAAQSALFDAADLNRNGKLGRRELSIFAQRQAGMTTGA